MQSVELNNYCRLILGCLVKTGHRGRIEFGTHYSPEYDCNVSYYLQGRRLYEVLWVDRWPFRKVLEKVEITPDRVHLGYVHSGIENLERAFVLEVLHT